MAGLKTSFEDVAEWCERHLEDQRGREIGMTFGAMLRAYGRLATLSSRLHGEERSTKERQLDARAEGLLMKLSVRFLMAHRRDQMPLKLIDPAPISTNMIYDTGP